MPTLSFIKADILTLNDEQQANLLSYLSEILSLSRISITDCREARFSKGKACLHCENHEVWKYGITCGKQRYKCKSCRRTLTNLSKSVLSSSKLLLEDWLEYAKCMVLGFSIRRAAIQIGVHQDLFLYASSTFRRYSFVDWDGTCRGSDRKGRDILCGII